MRGFPPGLIRRALASGLVALLTFEGCARLDDHLRQGAPLWGPYSINTLFSASPLGREGRPNASFGKWRLNSLGYRGPDIAPGRTNIVVAGASETFGIYESPDHEYPRLLQRRLDEWQPERFNVVNAAIPGMRIGRVDYLSNAMTLVGARYVVLYPTPANYIGATTPYCGRPTSPVPVQLGVSDHVRLVGRLETLFKANAPDFVMNSLRKFYVDVASREVPVAEDVSAASVDAFREDLRCAIRTIEANGAIPILLTHATYFGPVATARAEDRAMLVAWRRFYPDIREEGLLRLGLRANEVIRAIGRETGTEVIDAARGVPPGPGHFADFVHFTDQGAAVMAALIAERLRVRASASPSADLSVAAGCEPRSGIACH
jgi:hypothetical protein